MNEWSGVNVDNESSVNPKWVAWKVRGLLQARTDWLLWGACNILDILFSMYSDIVAIPMNVSCVPMSNLYVCIQSKHNNDELGIADGIKTTTNVDIRKMVKADSARKSGMKFVQYFPEME